MQKLFALSYLLASTALMASECTWPTWRHDHHNTGSTHCSNVTFSDVESGALTLKWSSLSSAGVQVTPVIVNGVVYYGDLAGNFFALDANTGAQVAPPFSLTGYGVHAPATVDNNAIYVTFVPVATPANDIVLYKLDLNLNIVWGPISVNPGVATGLTSDIYAGPVVIDNLVIIATSNATPEEVLALTPTFRGGFQAFNISDGSFNWRTTISTPPYGTSGGSWSTGGIDKKLGLMFVGTTNATSAPASPYTDSLLAIDYTSGAIKWHQQYTADDVYSFKYACGPDYDLGASPNLFTICIDGKKIDVVGAASKAGCYRVFERATGKPVWKHLIFPKGSVPSIDGNPSAAYAHGTVYTVGIADTSGISYNAFSVLAQYGIKFGDFAPILTLINYLATTDLTYIQALDAKNGKLKWSNGPHTGATLSSITEANGVLYTGDFSGRIRGIDAHTGAEALITVVADSSTQSNVVGPITIYNNNIYFPVGIGGSAVSGVYAYGK